MNNGGIILYPTDTVWGLGCDARNPQAVARLFELKNRADKAMIVLVGSLAQLESIIPDVPEVAYQLIEYTDKPLTIIYDSAHMVAPQLLGPDGTLAVRLPKHRFARDLCLNARYPIVSTSANFSGQPTAATFNEINPDLMHMVDYVCTSLRDQKPGKPSSIMRLSSGGEFKILR